MIIAFDARTGQIATIDGSPGTPSPPAVVWTSHLYPVEVVEAIASGASAQVGRLFEQPIDGVNVSATLVSGLIARVIGYVSYTTPTEAIDVGATIQSGAITRVIGYQTSNAPPESLDVGATVQSGSLVRVIGYVDTTLSEALDVSATVLGGTLA